MKTTLIIFSSILFYPFYASSQVLDRQVDTLTIQLPDISLHAVLSKPLNVYNPPIVLIIAGSGPTDLNGNQPGVINNSLKYLSDELVDNKIATLRFDKRGIGKSIYSGFSESNLTIDKYAEDVVSIIAYLKEKEYTDIYVIGHSEGSLIGLIALQELKIKGFISIAGAGNSADVILKKQLKPKLPPDFFNSVELIIDSLKNGNKVENVSPQLNMLFRPSVQPYLISWFKYNPAELVKNINYETLIVQGNKDIQVDNEEAHLLLNANKNAKIVEIKNMNHILKTINGGIQENIQSYTNPGLEINKNLIDALVTFINN